jgi:hypothetical protein
MIGLLCFVLAVLASPFKSKLWLEAENAVLRHQLIILRRRLHGRVGLKNHDRWFFYPANWPYGVFTDRIRETIPAEDQVLMLFEEDAVKGMDFGNHVHLLHTYAFLLTLENLKVIPSAEALVNQIHKAGRNLARDTFERRARVPSGDVNHWQRSPGKVSPLDDVSRISTIRRALRSRYDDECLSDRLGRNLKLTVNPRYEIGRVHDREFSSI